MLDNGNRELFIKAFGLKETDALLFAKRFKNRHAQHNYKDAHEIGKRFCYYNLYDQIEWLNRKNREYYGGSYKVLDHSTRFYSSIHECYIMTAQPYEFQNNIEFIKHTLNYYDLSFTVIEGLTWHSVTGGCTLYCIGDYEKLLYVFGKVDFKGE